MVSATLLALLFSNHADGPADDSAPSDRTLPIRPTTLLSSPPTPSTTIPSIALNKFSGRSKIASMRFPIASVMLTTKSDNHSNLSSSVNELSMPVTKSLMEAARLSISFGICATIPTTDPIPFPNRSVMLPPKEPSVLPRVLEIEFPTFFAVTSAMVDSDWSNAPFRVSMLPIADCTFEKPSLSFHVPSLFNAEVRPDV